MPAITGRAPSRGFTGSASGGRASSSPSRRPNGSSNGGDSSSLVSPPPPPSAPSASSSAGRPPALTHGGRSRSAPENYGSSGSNSGGAFPPLSPSRRPPRKLLAGGAPGGAGAPPMTREHHHHRGHTYQSEGGGSHHHPPLAASASAPVLPSQAARNLAVDFFPEATAGGTFRPRGGGGGGGGAAAGNNIVDANHRGRRHPHPLMSDAVGLDVDDASSIDSQYSSESASGSGSGSGSYESEDNNNIDNNNATAEEPDPVNTSAASSSFVRNQSTSMLSAPHALDEEQLDDIFRQQDGGHPDDAWAGIPRATEIYGSSASLAHQVQGNHQQQHVQERAEKQAQQKKSRRQKEYLLSQHRLLLSTTGGVDDPGPPGLVESPDSDDSSVRKQSSSGIISSTTDDVSTRDARSANDAAAAVGAEFPGRDETLMMSDLLDSSHLSSTQSSIPRTVYYTPQVTPNAKPSHSHTHSHSRSRHRPNASMGGEVSFISPSPGHHRRTHSTGGIHFAASAAAKKSPAAAITALPLDSRHHKIDFFCYGNPEEVPSEGEEGYSAPLSPGSYLNSSTLDGSAELEDVARKAAAASSSKMSPSRDRRGTVIATDDRAGAAAATKHVAPAQVVSPSPTKQNSSELPANDGGSGGLYTVEDIVRASATAISRVLNLSLNDEVDENMEEITRQAYEVLQSTQQKRKSV